ncbi:MAG: 50S ribosomal protein L33 [Candidatus Magasanikbacteria bacterium CG_4_9_14_0_2_um_filter_41_10]|uniref:Large ribosomal subunit protein bL33 n=1 Tax=Candidatus Magasanikbacteria bacterium CG_4_10_14_0_2_um_filter_41_31 TaxID=1974639 RepID=A0A2M7V2G9_9BACT|nr:MAG: 50S ribosomal protein L33 [Candidatus Magasanikbacteria bacterium CG_4_10_14_0_2_um_filter_41_31]PJC53852.1 MAG: 50S ribosomal protein L33 [Candidatus Magasanikbacteria bacterium CG_4_9_14_0_2_um_filter_41_10]
MAQKQMIKLQCEQCKQVNYFSRKNKQKLKDRLELMKLCSTCGTHILHKETK